MLKAAVIVVIAVVVAEFIMAQKEDCEEKKWSMAQREQEFFDACAQAGILSLDDLGSHNRNKPLEIAKHCKLIP